jgi:hypothetical protein
MSDRFVIAGGSFVLESDAYWQSLRCEEKVEYLFRWNKRMAQVIEDLGALVLRLESRVETAESQVAAISGRPPA